MRQGCAFFNLYSEPIRRELEVRQGFIIDRPNLNNIRCTNDTVLIVDTGKKPQEVLDKTVKESVKKGLIVNCKKTEYKFVSKRNSSGCKLRIGDVKMKKQYENEGF